MSEIYVPAGWSRRERDRYMRVLLEQRETPWVKYAVIVVAVIAAAVGLS